MFMEYVFRDLPKSWYMRTLVAPYRLLEVIFASCFIIVPLFYVAGVALTFGWLIRHLFLLHPNRITLKAWIKARLLIDRGTYYLFDSSDYAQHDSLESDVRSIIRKNPNAVQYLLSEPLNESLTSFIFAELLDVAERDKFSKKTDEEFSAVRIMILKSLYIARERLAEVVTKALPPESKKGGKYYSYSTPYSKFIRGYRDLTTALSKLTAEEYESNKDWLKELYNALYRPLLHLHIAGEGTDEVLLPTYYSKYDTLEGYLYECQLKGVPFDRYSKHKHEEISELLTKDFPDSTSLPEEWRMRLAEAAIAEKIAEYASSAVWKENEFKSEPLPYWASTEESKNGLWLDERIF